MSGLVAVPIIQSESLPVYYDQLGKPKDAVRWLFFPGDVISPRRRRELRTKVSREVFFQGRPFLVMEVGGEELGSPCLTRTKDTIPRCMFTPLEVGAEWIPAELVPVGADTWKGVATPNADPFQSQNVGVGLTGSPFSSWKGSHPGVKMWPGEVIRQILQVSMNDLGMSKGLIEIEAFAGITWGEAMAEGLQDYFFPGYPGCVAQDGQQIVTLARIEEMVVTAKKKSQGGSMFDRAADEMLSACDQFRHWARARIAVEEILVGQPATGGFAHKFSDVCESLMAQVEYVPEKRRLENVTGQTAEITNLIAQVAANKGGNDDSLKELMAMLAKNQEYLAQVVAGMNQQKPAEPIDDKPKTPQIPKIKS